MKKGQVEIIGLVVIVIIVTIAIFYSYTLKEPNKTREAAERYTDEELAGNYLIVLLESATSEHCAAPTIRELAIECVRERETGYEQRYHCPNPCGALTDNVTHIVDQTLKEWGYNYELTYTYKTINEHTDNLTLNITSNPDCSNVERQTAPGLQFISLYPYDIKDTNTNHPKIKGSALFELQLC